MNLFERLGGEAALEVAVDHFYQRTLADPELLAFFAGVDLAALRAHQKAFLTHVLGGPVVGGMRNMQEAHGHLKIETRHFYSVADHLLEALASMGVDDDLNAEVVSLLEPLSKQIVNTH